jgi:lysozyme
MRKGGAFVALMLMFVGAWEGYSAIAYRDIVGVLTICYGETKNVRAGQRATKAECDARLVRSLVEHEDGMLRCVRRAMPASVHAAALSLTYNIGVGAWCRSTAARLVDAGAFKAACEAMTRFNRAGGRVLRGLVNRREAEFALCVRDL